MIYLRLLCYYRLKLPTTARSVKARYCADIARNPEFAMNKEAARGGGCLDSTGRDTEKEYRVM